MNTTITAEKDLTAEGAEEIRAIQNAAFTNQPLFVHQRWYGIELADDDLWFGVRREGRLVASVRVLHRRILTPRGELTVGGIGNVCSHPAARGTGAAKACMRAVGDYLTGGGQVDFGMLFGGHAVHDFYASLGWEDIDNELASLNADGERRVHPASGQGHTMIYPGRKPLSEWPTGQIDLNGHAW